ncbi:MAG TPA: bifunctional MaoC family dehydratase N-terminal/OB-fold nucleic acid binding domain-containing protein [Spongiibacteraceae bacterium]|jgi:uncharacterized OB-fold protein/acyl dehydratase|nr:bifunctional MaoC family dehydratase N-terminal/OB-fold nucleic acid binding domain-containing protein [Spongiibacteraceae bacterium]HUH38692.1 bifunctional MaoC family dehydratase N-terminal/OB-fold nucleic acid binding domain-containing protein [Spongiibacteraceae bacterium]
MNEQAKALYQRMQTEALGNEVGPYTAWYPVNQAMIDHWCEAMGDSNPVYRDAAAARATGRAGVIAPPTMLQVWNMRNYANQVGPGSTSADPFAMFGMLEEAGYVAVVAVNCEQEYHRELSPGDEIHHTSQIETISEEKSTALGVGFFLTQLARFFDQHDELVGEMRFRVFKYKPHQRPDAAPKADDAPPRPKRMRAVRNWDTGFFWEGADAGELRIQRCKGCQTLRHPPSPMCPDCQSLEWDYVRSSGRGTVYSYVVMHYPPIPPFEYPNPIALVELEEGTRLITQLKGVTEDEIEIGMPVEVAFTEVEPGMVLPLFVKRGG